MNTDPGHREHKVIALLDEWPWNLGGVVIGGYSLSAYGKPRYSSDVDIVIPSSSSDAVKDWLHRSGMSQENS